MKVHKLFANTVWKLESQNARLKNKHPVLLNVCHYNFVHSFVTQSLFRHTNDLLFNLSFLTLTSSLIDFLFFTRQYLWRNSKTNGRSSSSNLIRRNQSVPTFRLLFRTLLCIATITVNVILQQFGWLATFIAYSCVENNELYFLLFGAPGLDRHPVSRRLVTKIKTIHVTFEVDKYKNVTWFITCHSNALC